MRNIISTLLFIAIISVALTAACTQTQKTNTNATSETIATPAPTPDKETIAAEITRMEKDWPRIMKEKDGATVRRIEADDIILLSFTGVLSSKEQDIKDAEAGNMTFDAWDVSEISVKVIDNDAAVASVLMSLSNAKFKIDESHSENISGHYRALDTFARRNGQWQVVASSVVKLSPEAESALTATASPTPPASTTPANKPSPATKPSPKLSPVRPQIPHKMPSPPPANQ